jgi:fructose-1,6-bisphosphatase
MKSETSLFCDTLKIFANEHYYNAKVYKQSLSTIKNKKYYELSTKLIEELHRGTAIIQYIIKVNDDEIKRVKNQIKKSKKNDELARAVDE